MFEREVVTCRFSNGDCDYGGIPERVTDCSDCPTFLHWERKQIEEDLRAEYENEKAWDDINDFDDWGE